VDWPADLPVAEIVARRLCPVPAGAPVTALYAMLCRETLVSLKQATVSKRFLFARSPHPTLLWVVALAVPAGPPRWLRVFFDLLRPDDRELLARMVEVEPWLLLFERESTRLMRQLTLHTDVRQRDLLSAWLRLSLTLPAQTPAVARQNLLAECERLKPQILADLASEGSENSRL